MAKPTKKTKRTPTPTKRVEAKRATAPKTTTPAKKRPAKTDKPGKKKGRQTIIIIRN